MSQATKGRSGGRVLPLQELGGLNGFLEVVVFDLAGFRPSAFGLGQASSHGVDDFVVVGRH
jgi:hypothetical protein